MLDLNSPFAHAVLPIDLPTPAEVIAYEIGQLPVGNTPPPGTK